MGGGTAARSTAADSRLSAELAGVGLAGVTLCKRAFSVRYRIFAPRHAAVQLTIPLADSSAVTERAIVVVVMPCIAVMPVPVMRPTGMNVPPAGVIPPIPGTVPCEPCVRPEPVVDHRPIDIYGLDDIVRSIDVLVAYHLYGHLVLLVSLHIYRRDVLIDVFRQDSLQNDQPFVAFAGLHYAQVIHLSVAVEVEVAEHAVRIVEHRLELLQVLSLCEQFGYHLQIESFRNVRTVGRNRYRLVCP